MEDGLIDSETVDIEQNSPDILVIRRILTIVKGGLAVLVTVGVTVTVKAVAVIVGVVVEVLAAAGAGVEALLVVGVGVAVIVRVMLPPTVRKGPMRMWTS